jgi:hypothetical protein
MYSLPYLTLDKDARQVRRADIDAFAARRRRGALDTVLAIGRRLEAAP